MTATATRREPFWLPVGIFWVSIEHFLGEDVIYNSDLLIMTSSRETFYEQVHLCSRGPVINRPLPMLTFKSIYLYKYMHCSSCLDSSP